MAKQKLIHGNAFELLSYFTRKADLIFSDPPYLIEKGGNTTNEMGGMFSRDAVYKNDGKLFDSVPTWDEIAQLCWDLLKENGEAVIMANDKNINKAQNAFEAVGFRHHRHIIWNKVTVTPARNGMNKTELALYMFKGKTRNWNNCGTDNIFTVPEQSPLMLTAKNKKLYGHPTEKPVQFIESVMSEMIDRDSFVIDPFIGSGSTMAACKRLGINSAGFEIDETYFKAAQKRMDDETASPSLFDINHTGATEFHTKEAS